MAEVASSLLGPWSNFYVMIGSSAAALTGLMFVVITLLKRQDRSSSNDGIATFSTPTVLHFCGALLVAAIGTAPWRSLFVPAILLGLAGFYGVVHVLRVMLRARRLDSYRPDLEDWLSYVGFPLLAYGTILVGALAIPAAPRQALFAVAGAALLLIFMGVHNAWDVVTFIVSGGMDDNAKDPSTRSETSDGPR